MTTTHPFSANRYSVRSLVRQAFGARLAKGCPLDLHPRATGRGLPRAA